jgi:hypothetical protein
MITAKEAREMAAKSSFTSEVIEEIEKVITNNAAEKKNFVRIHPSVKSEYGLTSVLLCHAHISCTLDDFKKEGVPFLERNGYNVQIKDNGGVVIDWEEL